MSSATTDHNTLYGIQRKQQTGVLSLDQPQPMAVPVEGGSSSKNCTNLERHQDTLF
jgi:hypothetical protein